MLKKLFGRPPEQKSAEKPVIRVGVIGCMTGFLTNYSKTALEGLEWGLSYATDEMQRVAGKKITVIVEDDAGNPETAEQVARRMVLENKVDILIGSTSSQASVKLSRVALDLKRVFLVTLAATDVLTGEWFNRYLFRISANTTQDALTAGRYAVEHLGKNFCFLSPDYIWGHQSRTSWWRVISDCGGEVVGDIMANPAETDFRSDLKYVLERKPDVLVPSWAGATVKDLFLQMKEVGVLDRVKIAGNLVDRQTIKGIGEAMAGMICAAKYYYEFPHNPVNDWLVQRCQEVTGEPPDLFHECGFTAAIALVKALEKTGGNPDPEMLIPALEGMQFQGPKGLYIIRPEDHQTLQPMYLAVMVKPTDLNYCVPRLIREISAAETAPPITRG